MDKVVSAAAFSGDANSCNAVALPMMRAVGTPNPIFAPCGSWQAVVVIAQLLTMCFEERETTLVLGVRV